MSSFGQGWDGACPAQWLCQLLQHSQAKETPMTLQLLGKALQRNVRLDIGNEKNSWE